MTTHAQDDLAEAFTEPALAALLGELEAIAAQAPPPVGAELAAVLTGAVPLAVGRSRRPRTSSLAVIALLSGGVVAGGVGAAAADELPAPVQRVVSRVVSTLTPFDVPHPDHAPVRHDPGPARPSPVVPDDDQDSGLPAEAPRTTAPRTEPDDSASRSGEGSGEDSAEESDEDSAEELAEEATEGSEATSSDDDREGTDDGRRGDGRNDSDSDEADSEDTDGGGEDRRGDEATDEREGGGSDTERDD